MFLFDREAAASVIERWREYGNRLSIDYEHQALEPVTNGPVPAAGWFDLELREDGLWAINVEWTERAQALLAGREYRYFSPAFYTDEKGRIVELINLALTNIPATKRMQPLVARNDDQRRYEMTEILRQLGLRENQEAEAGAIITRLTSLERTLVALTGRQTPDEALAVVQGWRAAAEELPRVQERLTVLENERQLERRRALVEQGKREGKLTPAMLTWAEQQSPEALEAFLSVAPRVIPESVGESLQTPLDWHKLSASEKQKLYEENVELYRRLRKEALGY
ncbi:hypothetical protein [Meiothermus phage MMP7]|nr:hypothetical protein [Meiothermus phage MMP7]